MVRVQRDRVMVRWGSAQVELWITIFTPLPGLFCLGLNVPGQPGQGVPGLEEGYWWVFRVALTMGGVVRVGGKEGHL